ncbi:response regulator transcription factor [Streptomyces sp. P9-2B-2]|uniref:response regulator transcription factor n=1 Tax=Streptomyces TaxID=1883 RepID=UPI002252E530|nr:MULTISPECIES: response regulator transcription factor [Streptomyces]MCX4637662.1 response regulator transcription factor [Streptomyces platensis]WJY36199.1 response regulator transcription factor [Streptomyces sp. P9-2B-2]
MATSEKVLESLELAGYQVAGASTRAAALVLLAAQRFDLLIIDTLMPDAHDLAGYQRLADGSAPVLFLTDPTSLDGLCPWLSLGVADYVLKPLRVPEILARVQVLLHDRGAARPERTPRQAADLTLGDLILNDATCQVWRGRRELSLSPTEYRLLRCLLLHPGQVLSKEQISRNVWGEDRARTENTIESLISRLRRKVDREAPPLIHTRKGFGYWLGAGEGVGGP